MYSFTWIRVNPANARYVNERFATDEVTEEIRTADGRVIG